MNNDYDFSNDVMTILTEKWKELEKGENTQVNNEKELTNSELFEYLEVRGSSEYWHDFIDIVINALNKEVIDFAPYFHAAYFIIKHKEKFIEIRDFLFEEFGYDSKTMNIGQTKEEHQEVLEHLKISAEEYLEEYMKHLTLPKEVVPTQSLEMSFRAVIHIMLQLEVLYFSILFDESEEEI